MSEMNKEKSVSDIFAGKVLKEKEILASALYFAGVAPTAYHCDDSKSLVKYV